MKLYGKIPVIERIKANPQSIRKIYIQEGHPDTAYIRKKAQKWGLLVISIKASKMIKIARNLNTQGLLAEVDDQSYLSFDELLQKALKKKETLIFLDGVTDPQNLGGIIRSAACLGGFSIVLPTHGSVDVTESALRVSAGGDNYVSVTKVSNLNQALMKAKDAGFWIAGTVVQGGEDINAVKFNFPLVLVIGSEHKGVREAIRKNVDIGLTIPMAHARLSMNVAHATTIFCYEIMRQKK
jgi:23S rRNA (guanosine2251-2'-O)-methyltransferase